ncbi:MAG: glycine-rich domain-containing protein, partial [Halobacteriaceae archaeon]
MTTTVPDSFAFRHDASGADFDGDSAYVQHSSSDASRSVYKWTPPSDASWERGRLEVLVMAGGGGGGRAGAINFGAAGGGGGGVFYSKDVPTEDLVRNADESVTIVVGAGGDSSEARSDPTAESGFQGENSIFGHIFVAGGGGGASWNGPPENGGSGGGGNAAMTATVTPKVQFSIEGDRLEIGDPVPS